MSIESVSARIEELQARIQSLSPEPPALPPAITERLQQPESLPDSRPAGTPVFPLTLKEKLGELQLRPVAGGEKQGITPEIEALIEKYSALNGLNPALVRAVITAESDGDPKCASRAGAKGLMQLMPCDIQGYGVRDPFDPEQNIAAGTRQLADKLKLFNGDERLALAAYNAGSGAVRKYGGVPPYPETIGYIRRVLGLMGRER